MTTKAFTAVLRSMAKERWRSLAKELIQYRDHNEKRNRLSTMLSRAEMPLYPLAEYPLRNDKGVDRDSLKDADRKIRQLNGFLAQGVKLVAAATGNVVGNKTVRLLSPRIGNTNRADNE
ncbi:hypothetical protein OSTOST_19559, partial [Ostertagia ostertagi]